ncbi:MAG: hypothetical protein HY719_17005 [Planctomycetes bacterium]|nr:hypothetical protein [Planctomycetota bacterium]
MKSLPRNSRPTSLRVALTRAAVCATFAGALLVADSAVMRSYLVAMDNAERELLAAAPAARPAPTAPLDRVADARAAVVFAGNSVIQTGIDPVTFQREAGIDPSLSVRCWCIDGGQPATVLRALRLVGVTPPLVIVDVAPRSFFPTTDERARDFITGIGDEATKAGKRIAQERLTGAVDAALATFRQRVSPRLGDPRPMSEHARAVRDGVAHGFLAYRGAYGGNIATVETDRFSIRARLLNTSPSRERFKAQAESNSLDLMRKGQPHADAVIADLTGHAFALAERGGTVIMVNMPLSPRLRALDERLNGARYSRLSSWLDGSRRVRFVDLGADPALAAMPFYDGHHREFVETRKATKRMAAILRPFLPATLMKAAAAGP